MPALNDKCPICNSTTGTEFIQIHQMPIFNNIFFKNRDEALTISRGDIILRYCKSCGHIWNSSFDPNKMNYSQAYENSLHFSERFQEYIDSLTHSLIDRYSLYHKNIIEIGSGKGDFLKIMCNLGSNKGIGFDPAYDPQYIPVKGTDNIFFIQDYFLSKYFSIKSDFICCRHTVEHIYQPISLMNLISDSINQSESPIIFFEVPNAIYMFKKKAIWDIIYEHYSYFTDQSLATLFKKTGFSVLNLYDSFEGQFLCIEAQKGSSKSSDTMNFPVEIKKLIDSFSIDYQTKINSWKNRLDRFLSHGKKIVLWGAGSKGVTFLNVFRNFSNINYIVDINPRKQGLFVPGTGQKIISPEFLQIYEPDIILIMNPIYENEVSNVLKELEIHAEVMIV